MQKLVILVSCALIIFFVSIVYAAPVGNPTEPAFLYGKYPIKVTGTASSIFKRELDEDEAKIDKSMEYTSKIAVNINKKVEVYGILGVADSFELREDTKLISGSSSAIDLEPAFLYGCGAGIALFDTQLMGGILRIGVDGKYQRFKADIDKFVQDSTSQTFSNDEVTSQEWQLALGVSYQYDKFVPYMGGKYSDVEIEEEVTISNTEYTQKLNSDKIVGVFVGCDFIFSDNVKLNVEGRLIDETAVSLSGTIMF